MSRTIIGSALLSCAFVLACGPKNTTPPTTTPTETAPPVVEVQAVPSEFGPLTPRIIVADVAEAVEFYGTAFGAKTVYTLPGPDGTTLIHAQIVIGDSMVMLDPAEGPMKDPTMLGGSPATLVMYVEDADAVVATATEAGALVQMPLEDQFWGDRYGELVDPFGHRWAVTTHIEDLTEEQIMKRAELAMAPHTEGKKKKKGKKPKAADWTSIEGTPATQRVPAGYHTVNMALTVSDAAKAIEYYTAVFGATERTRMPAPDGRLMHAEIEISGDVLILSDEFPEMGTKSATTMGGSPVHVQHYVADVDATFASAVEGGARTLVPPGDLLWGDRHGSILDPSGFPWGIATHVEDVPPDEIAARFEAMMARTERAAAKGLRPGS